MGRRQDLVLPSIHLDRGSPAPMHEQIRRELARALAPMSAGTHLPSSRLLARVLGVSRNTVLAAYEALVADGLIEGHQGSGMRVTAGRPGRLMPFDPRRVLRDAQYPSRTLDLVDQDGTPLYLTY